MKDHNNNIPLSVTIDQRPMVFSKVMIDRLLKVEEVHPRDILALLVFYHYTSIWQCTNKIRCTTMYAANGLGMPIPTVRKCKAILIRMGLIEKEKMHGR